MLFFLLSVFDVLDALTCIFESYELFALLKRHKYLTDFSDIFVNLPTNSILSTQFFV